MNRITFGVLSHLSQLQILAPQIAQLPITEDFVKEACMLEFTRRTDPPLSVVGQCFSNDAVGVVVEKAKHEVTLTFPREVSQATRNKVRLYVEENITPGYTVKAEPGSNSIEDFGISTRKQGRQRFVNDSDNNIEDDENGRATKRSKRKNDNLDALGNPIIYIHNAKLAHVIEPSLSPDWEIERFNND